MVGPIRERHVLAIECLGDDRRRDHLQAANEVCRNALVRSATRFPIQLKSGSSAYPYNYYCNNCHYCQWPARRETERGAQAHQGAGGLRASRRSRRRSSLGRSLGRVLMNAQACPLCGGDLNRSTQHFVLKGKDGVSGGNQDIVEVLLRPRRRSCGIVGSGESC